MAEQSETLTVRRVFTFNGRSANATAIDAASAKVAGTVTVVHDDSPEKFTLVGKITTKPGAKTMALDVATYRIYLSTAQYGPPPSPTAENPKPRPSILPGAFEVLVLER